MTDPRQDDNAETTTVYALTQQNDNAMVVQQLLVDVCSNDEHGTMSAHYHVFHIIEVVYPELHEAIDHANGIAYASQNLAGFDAPKRVDLSESE